MNRVMNSPIQGKVFIGHLIDSYSAVNDFWPVEEFAELVTGLMGVVNWRGVGIYLLGTSG